MIKPTVLIIEDNDITRKMFRLWLRDQFNVLEAVDGKTALTRLQKKIVVDSILLDYQLPDLSGIDLLKYLSNHYQGTPVIMLTAHGSEQVAVEALKLGAFDYYVKGDLTQKTLNRAIISAIKKTTALEKLKEKNSKLKFMAYHDHLTGLFNREQFEESAKKSLARASRFKKKIAILMMDLDHFKKVNDTLGHEVGDLLIKEVASRFIAAIREMDTLARLGGDEFAIIIDELKESTDVEFIAKKLIAVTNEPFFIKNHTIHISVSVGIAVFPEAAKTVRELMNNADSALYAAKKSGRNTFCYFEKNLK